MTVEKRTTIGTNDILAAELECKECHHRVVKLTGIWQPMIRCPNCGASWAHGTDAVRLLEESLFNLRRIAPDKGSENKLPFNVRLEINGDDKP